MNPRHVLLSLLLLVPFAAFADEPLTSLEEQMSGADFERAGLDKLTEEELAFLNRWLDNRGVAVDAPAAPEPATEQGVSEAQMGLRGAEPERVVIESRLIGKFNGWSGRTLFKLENGQVWQQIGGGSYYASADSPAVRIEPKMFGSWKLYVEGIGRSVKVKRIK
ncbi:MAG: hypothetical protein R3200_16500 [Xanthomonadales bacterium]|nr:hypothetical protein [Xanthomonadales bacterium]